MRVEFGLEIKIRATVVVSVRIQVRVNVPAVGVKEVESYLLANV